MRSRENFSLEPSGQEREITQKVKENPKAYVEDQIRMEMEQRFDGMSASDLVKYGERGSKERMNMIENFINYYDLTVKEAEKIAQEKLHPSFYSVMQKTELIGSVLEKVIKTAAQREKLEEDRVNKEKSAAFKGRSKRPPETLHYGD